MKIKNVILDLQTTMSSALQNEVSDLHKQQFRSALMTQIRSHLKEYASETGNSICVNSLTEQFTNEVYEKSLNDEDFYRMIQEDGAPKTWRGFWIREYIDEYSTLYIDYPLA